MQARFGNRTEAMGRAPIWNLLRLGRLEEARQLYERLVGYSNHLGLLSEMIDPVSGEALGNFPQALSHLTVIIAGVELTQALEASK